MVVKRLSAPGEVAPEKGRKRAKLFAACLQQIVVGFRAEFYVNSDPHKLRFELASDDDRAFTFDVQGRLEHRGSSNSEVWIEAKGYDKDSGLLGHYREFLKDVALARMYIPRFETDQFWFVSSAPFGCRDGAHLSSPQWIREALLESTEETNPTFRRDEFDALERDTEFVSLADSIRVLYVTEQLVRTTGLKLFVSKNDSIWELARELYYGELSEAELAIYSGQVAALNNLPDPNRIYPGQELDFNFRGWPPEEDSAEVDDALVADVKST